MKTVIVKTYNTNEAINEVRVVTKDGQPTVIKAGKHVNYDFFDESIGRAPNHIITKRQGKDLHVSFEREGVESDLIIEDFYENDEQGLVGIAENGRYYYYIPDTGEVADYVTQLQAGDVEGQALGGEEMLVPFWIMMVNGLPWWPLLGVVPFLIRDKDDDPSPFAEASPNTTPDIVLAQVSEDEKVNGVTINVLDNDSSSNINKAGIKLISPQTNQISTEEDGKKVTVKGQGTWTVDDEGNVTFVREEGFTGNPTPINYIVPNNQGEYSVSTAVAVDYGHALTADNASGKTGTPVTQDVLANDNKDGLVTDTLQLVNPATGETGLALVVAGEGKWELVLGGDNKPTGEVTFTPEDGFTDNPTPIKYRVTTTTGGDYETTVGVSYDSVSYGNGHTRPDVQVGNLGEPVTIDVTTNDNSVDASSVRLIDPANPGTPETPILVDTVK